MDKIREGFILLHHDVAERNGVTYKAEPANRDIKCESEEHEWCAFWNEDCKGVPCEWPQLRQYFPTGKDIPKYPIVWLKCDNPD